MNEGVSVSVVIPVFNRAELIPGALDSVKAQTYRPLEVVVVDDGSSDSISDVVQEWSLHNCNESLTINYISQENQGGNAARNEGIAESNSPFIAFLDSDDRWTPDKLVHQLTALQANQKAGGVYCGLRTVDLVSGDTEPVMPREYLTGDLLARMLVQDVSSPTSCWMVRKECFDKVGNFDTSLPARQDWDMWIRLASRYEIGCVPEVLVEMGEHMGERVRSDPSREISAHKTIFKKYAHLRAQFPFWVSLAARSAMYRRRGRVYFHRKDARLRAIGMQLLAIMVWPFNFDSYAALLGVLMPARLRKELHVLWNRLFGKTRLGIESH